MTNWNPGPRVALALIIPALAVIIIGIITAIKLDAIDTSSPLGAVAGAQIGYSAATATSSPYPTITHTPQPPKVLPPENIILYKTVQVTRLVERIVTATPAAHTPRPSWTPTATVDFLAKYKALELQAAYRGNVLQWLGMSIMIMGTLFILILVSVALFNTLRTQEEPQAQPPPLPQVPVNDAHRDRAIRALHKAGWSGNQIQEYMFGYQGGYAHHVVNKALNHSPTADDFDGAGVA